MNYRLGTRSRDRLKHVHPDLILVVARAIQITEVDFTVLEGLRTVEKQLEYMAAGASMVKNPEDSFHVPGEDGLAYAVDLGAWVGGTVRWDWPLYNKIAAAMKTAAKELGIKIQWGGDWRTFKDGPHFQLARKS